MIQRLMIHLAGAAIFSLGLALAQTPCAAVAQPQDAAKQILDASGVKGGLIVHVGCGDGKLTAALKAGDGWLVQGLDADPANVEKARKQIQSLGLYGPVSVDRFDGKHLPYAENLVNLVVAEDLGKISMDEVMRALCPNGVACVKKDGAWTKTVKPRPKEIDEWTHYLHDAGNNAVANDAVVGPPRHLQWVGSPKWARHHDHMASLDAMVSANGRVFYIMDEGPTAAILLPSKWFLVARDAFNGTILWKRPIAEWNTQLWPLKSGPNQLPRRLVAIGDRVYVTLGIDAPLSELDAATGKTIREYEGTQHTEEIMASDGVLYALVSPAANKWKEYRPKHTYVWDNTQRANRDWAWDEVPRRVMAFQMSNSAPIWNQEGKVAPLTLAVNRERIFLYDGERARCLDRKNGKEVWASEPIERKASFPTGYGPTLVSYEDVVLLSVENKTMIALAAASGKKLWSSEHHRGGHASPDDMLVINGVVWSGQVAAGADSGIFTGRDVRTGEVKSEFPCDSNAYWFHHRCYRSKATTSYVLTSRTGIEFVDVNAKHWTINHWVRGGCLYGVMPCNGLVYAPPHSCGCYLESKLFGLNALAPESASRKAPVNPPDSERLERGPAYAEISNLKSQIPNSKSEVSNLKSEISNSADWPTYRHDIARSAFTKAPVAADLKRAWQADLGGKLSSVVAADGKVFVASINAHTVHALDANTGKALWSYIAGGRVDSPPTIYQGLALFGSADGWVYCLRAGDGQLAWRFRAAPDDRKIMAYEQLESPWPVSGSVLAHDGAVYCVAGRSIFLDGGMRLLRLDPQTGRKLSETILDDRNPQTGEDIQKLMKGLDMPVALPDVLSCDGTSVYMRAQRFDLKGARQELGPIDAKEQTGEGVHLFSRSGFLDDAWWHRSFWMYGKGVSSGYGAWYRPGNLAPAGRLMAFDDAAVYGFDRKPEYMCNASVYEYYLYAANKQTTEDRIQRVNAANGKINAASPKKSASSSDWAARKKFSLTELSAAGFKWAEDKPPIQARAMALADKILFIAGPPDVVDEEQVFATPDDPAIRAKLDEQVAALEGRKGAQILAFSVADGKKLCAFELDSPPTFDGMAAAFGRLYLSCMDGKLICLGGEGAALKAAPGANLSPMDVSLKNTASAPAPGAAKAAGPSAAAEFAKVLQADIAKSAIGYQLATQGKGEGLVLKKLDAPLKGKVTLKCNLRFNEGAAPDRTMKNGFLIFGDTPNEDSLVKCGLRLAMKTAVIAQGTIAKGKGASEKIEMEAVGDHDLTVVVDLDSGQVTLTTAKQTVSAKLDRRMESIQYIGYCAMGSISDFSPIEISNK
ncbi:MAG: PQQ-binding-like beta-propeller repeat protein [Candidatus Sumerlaeota bacterium]|nr:PQQ-binding-like beta-propeller repeat protein [Candidatus Sumerlaeota bacterium]